MSGYARRMDANHGPVIDALRRCGWFCLDVHHIPSFVDVIAIRRGRVVFCEIKDGAKWKSRQRLRAGQQLLHEDLRASGAEVVVLRSREEAVRL